MNINDLYDTDTPLIVDEKGKFYLPKSIFCDVLNENTILVNTPSIGVAEYKVYRNKDGSMWINGNNISKYYPNANKTIKRLFLNSEIKEILTEL